jgi:hypothetical protein
MKNKELKDLMGTSVVERGCFKTQRKATSVEVLVGRSRIFRGRTDRGLSTTDPTNVNLRIERVLTRKNKPSVLNCAGSKRRGISESKVFRGIKEMRLGTLEGKEGHIVKLNIASIVTDQGI